MALLLLKGAAISAAVEAGVALARAVSWPACSPKRDA